MTEQILLTPMESPRRKFWKSWKRIGLAISAIAYVFSRWLPDFILIAAYICGAVVIVDLTFFIFRYLKDKLFWRVRNRLIGSFVFVGVIPLLVILGLVSLGIYLILGQLSAHYLETALHDNERLISEINMDLAGRITAADVAGTFPVKAASVFSRHSAQFPRLAARLSHRLQSGAFAVVAKYDPQSMIQDPSSYPGEQWLGGAASFEGILQDGSRLLLVSFRPIPAIAGYYLEMAAPLDRFVEERLRREKSLYVTFITHPDADVNLTQNGANVTIKSQNPEDKAAEKRIRQELELQNAEVKSDARKMITWYLAVNGKTYDSGKSEVVSFATFRVPREVIFNNYLALGGGMSRIFVVLFYILIGIFIAVELLSLFIGGAINRHITRSVHNLYQGILALQKGDLQHRIPVRRHDQLGLLAHSFNQMSGSIGRLLEEVVEKKRLEKELEIAREVQATLFPKQLPHPPGMSIFGGCKPARVVSGDYYDFIVEDESHLNIVVGDISGKGISAALLMASLQAAMRSQLLSSRHNDPEAVGKSLADVMRQLNRQIYFNSPPEKYATLFLSRYDADSRRLWYCNAGHLPPIVMQPQGLQSLEATGTVVGLFPDAAYQARSIDLTPGSLLAVFTDGVTEALNKADEEFGEKQLQEVLWQSSTRPPEKIWEYVISRVEEWQSDLPQYDDITLIVAKSS